MHLKLRGNEAKAAVLAITGELADLTEATVAEATGVPLNARRYLHGTASLPGRLTAAVAELDTILGRASQA